MRSKNKLQNYQIIWLVRRLFRALSQRSSALLENNQITVADRAVMEFLFPEHLLSVPEIAKKYQVSRQHIQVTVNKLLELEFVKTQANPKHKRSQLIKLTALGQQEFKKILQNEKSSITTLFAEIDPQHLQVTAETLELLLKKSNLDEDL
jgi:DNA-binding MarR family transcriptional regulator